jgi:DNA-binding FadR family transcriptional regulator
MTERIERRKLYQEVLERLMRRITSGEIAPGEHLPSERELMAVYGVGRPAVREALQSLERSGIVSIAHGERATVVVPTAHALVAMIASGAQHLLRMDPASLEHLKEMRLFLECGTARLAAARADGAGLALLRDKLDAHHELRDRPERFLGGDLGFHTQIAAMSGNPIVPVITEALLRWLAEYHTALVRAPGAEQLTLAEHERIYKCIAGRDPDAAERAMKKHLTRANALYRSLLRSPSHRGTGAKVST